MSKKNRGNPDIKTIPIKEIKLAYDVPLDDRFSELYALYMGDLGVTLEETTIELALIEPFSDSVEVPQHFINFVMDAIRTGVKTPALYVYRRGEKYVMSDNYPEYRAYVSLGWERVPVKILKMDDEKESC